MRSKSIEELTADFAEAVMAQNRCIQRGDVAQGNRHAERYVAAASELLDSGESAIEIFCSLLEHPNVSVRATVAAYLLKQRTERAVAVLIPIAQGRGLAALGAQMTLARYERGELEIG